MPSYITNTPTSEEINALIANPALKADFDAKYGSGASDEFVPTEIDNANLNKDAPVEGDGMLVDALQAPFKGVAEGAKETFNTVSQIATDLADATNVGNLVFGSDADNGLIGYKNQQELEKLREDKAEPVDPVAVAEAKTEEEESPYESTTEAVIGNIFQFATGWVTGGKVLKSLGWGVKAGSNITRSLVQGGIADFAAFDAYQERFTDFLIGYYPELEDSYISYLAADENDSFYEGKLKNTIEGLGFGLGAEVLFAMIRGGKQVAKLIKDDPKAAAKAIDDTGKQIEEITTDKTKGEAFPEGEEPTKIKGSKIKEKETEKFKAKFKRDSYNEILKDNILKARMGTMSIEEALDIPINLKQMGIENDDDLIIFTKTLIDTIDSSKAIKDSVKSHDQVLLEAESMLNDIPNAINFSYKLAADMEKGDSAMVAMKMLYKGIMKQATLDARNPNIADEIIDKQVEIAASIYNNFAKISKYGARTTSAGNMSISSLPTQTDDFLQDVLRGRIVKNNSGAKIYRKKLISIDPENTQVQTRLLRFFSLPQLIKYSNKLFINAILSNPKTHLINSGSNVMMAILSPIEQYAGGWLTMDKRTRREALTTLSGLFRFYKDSFKKAKEALINGDTILDRNTTKLDYETDKATTIVGKVVETPTRFLAAEDEFFKQINYRAYANAKIVSEAFDKNLSQEKIFTFPNGDKYSEFDKYVADRMEDIFRENGEAADEFLDALEYSQENTFTKKLEEKTAGGGTQAFVNKVPLFRQILPFVRTPVNIISGVLDRFPAFGMARPYFWKQLRSPDPAVRARAWGKQAFGTAFIGSILYYVNAGKITGGYERKERNLYKQKFDAGWRPYSVKFGDTYYSYERFDPLGSLVGLIADYAEIAADLSDEDRDALAQMNLLTVISGLDGQDIPEFSKKIAIRTVNNFTTKTYTKTLGDFLELLDSTEEGRWNRFAQSKIIAFFPNIIRNAVNQQLLIEAKTFSDTLKKATGIYGNTQDLSYNALGEKRYKNQSTVDSLLNPVTRSVETNDPLIKELAELNHGFSLPSNKIGKNGNIDLYDFRDAEGKSAYDKLNEIIEANDIRGSLKELINDTSYKDLANSYKKKGMNYKSQKIKLIESLLNEARKNALDDLLGDESFKSESGLSLIDAKNNDEENQVRNEEFQDLLPIK